MSVNVDEDPFDELFDRTLVLFTDRLGVIPDGIERSPHFTRVGGGYHNAWCVW